MPKEDIRIDFGLQDAIQILSILAYTQIFQIRSRSMKSE